METPASRGKNEDHGVPVPDRPLFTPKWGTVRSMDHEGTHQSSMKKNIFRPLTDQVDPCPFSHHFKGEPRMSSNISGS